MTVERKKKKSREKQAKRVLLNTWHERPVKGVMMPDGRWISYYEYGQTNQNHKIVFYFHSLGSSRLESQRSADAIAKGLGIRVINLDRPGYGRSSPTQSMSYLSFAEDVAHVAHALQISRYGVVGVGSGGPYALACAMRNEEYLRSLGSSHTSTNWEENDDAVFAQNKVVAVALVSSDLPYQDLPRSLFSPFLKTLYWQVKSLPSMLLRFLLNQELHATIFSEPEHYTEAVLMDRDTYYDHEGPELLSFLDQCVDNMREGMALHGIDSAWRELVLERQSPEQWGFRLEDIKNTPIHIWHAKKNRLIPIELTREAFDRIAKGNPNAAMYQIERRG